uniref:Uncharacterized protein n=2 Tax=Anguilla anguilla TaxID=7936 RepID=A0A0E9TKY8_ANGAN
MQPASHRSCTLIGFRYTQTQTNMMTEQLANQLISG